MWPRRFLRSDRIAERDLLLSILLGAAAALLFAVSTLLLARVIASAFIDQRALPQLRGELLAILALAITRALLLTLRGPLAQRASNRYRTQLRRRLLTSRLHRSTRADAPSGPASNTIIGSAVESLDEYVTMFLPAQALAGIVPIVVFMLIAVLDPWTTLVLALAGPLLMMLLAVIGRRTRDLAAERFEELSWLGSLYADLLRGLATLKTFGRELDALDTIEETSAHLGRSTMAVLRTAFQTSLVIEWAATASTALVAVEVSFRLVDRQLPFSTALAVLMLTPEFFTPLRTLAGAYHAGQSGAAALAAIDADLELDAEHEHSRGSGSSAGRGSAPGRSSAAIHRDGARPGDVRRPPSIRFDAVSFRHAGRSEDSLDGLSFSIDAGETVALDAPSGSGKTTVTTLLLGFESPHDGSILINGAPMADLDLARWRAQVAWVPQDPTIFSGTIADNICIGRPGADLSDVIDSARSAAIHDFITSLPRGYDTVVGERGARLSGGQCQRIALARALLVDAPVLILDEFTARLDPLVEQSILTRLEPILRSRTVLLITHRPTVLRTADRIVTLRSSDPERA